MAAITLDNFGAALAALSALSTAAFGLLDATKAFWGGVARVGFGHIAAGLKPFDEALDAAAGRADTEAMIRANWINGVSKADQKARVRALIKLGLSETTADSIAAAAHVDPKALKAAARRLTHGQTLTDADLNVLGRMNAVVDALLDGAFERADQQYRNVTRALAGGVAILLSLAAWFWWPETAGRPSFMGALAVGLLAVPIAPVAKDLTSALSTAMQALKAAKAL
jgi:hypothetical protein